MDEVIIKKVSEKIKTSKFKLNLINKFSQMNLKLPRSFGS